MYSHLLSGLGYSKGQPKLDYCMIFLCQVIKLASGFRSVNVSMFELILKGHAEGEAEAESQREEATDQAAAATSDLGEKDTGPRQVKLKSYPQDSFGTQNRSFHHSWYICVVKFYYDPVILSYHILNASKTTEQNHTLSD